jgi:predicted heme/steroid binding protein
MNPPNPSTLIGEKQELSQVEQLGTITLEELHKYHCNNPHRRCLSMFGTVYDVTSADKSYGPDGAYKEYAGHDITLALANHKTQEKWLDRFVKMKQKWWDDGKNWDEYFAAKYPVCGRLDKWDEDYEAWEELPEEEVEAFEKGCVIM